MSLKTLVYAGLFLGFHNPLNSDKFVNDMDNRIFNNNMHIYVTFFACMHTGGPQFIVPSEGLL